MSVLTPILYDGLRELIGEHKNASSFLRSHVFPCLPISGHITLIAHLFSCQIDSLNEAKRKLSTSVMQSQNHITSVLSSLSRKNCLQINTKTWESLQTRENAASEFEINIDGLNQISSRLEAQLEKEHLNHKICLIQGIICNIITVAFAVSLLSINFFDDEQFFYIAIGCGIQVLACSYTLVCIKM